MLQWISANIVTIAAIAAVALILGLAVWSLVRDKKKSAAGGQVGGCAGCTGCTGCSGCAGCSMGCHQTKK